jgi:DNA (cytosine-5)-methyltransferase 1
MLTVLVQKPLLLDLFCGAGGAAVGYEQAGFRVVGVDINPQPNYPFRFIQDDALAFPLGGYAVYHGSPVCKRWSKASCFHPGASEKYPDGLTPTRERFQATGKPFILENVVGAPLRNPIKLCGAVFGLRVYRHRLFESNVFLFQPHHPRHTVKAAAPGAIARADEFWSVGGHFGNKQNAALAMGITWMQTVDEIAQAIPPFIPNGPDDSCWLWCASRVPSGHFS